MRKILMFAVSMFFLANSCWAIQNIKIGNTEINPFVSTEGKYDSNIYLSSGSEKSAWINKTALGFKAGQKLGSKLSISGGYAMELMTYSKYQRDRKSVV